MVQTPVTNEAPPPAPVAVAAPPPKMTWKEWVVLAGFIISCTSVAGGVLSRFYYGKDEAIAHTTASEMSFKQLNEDYTDTKTRLQTMEAKLQALEINMVRLEASSGAATVLPAGHLPHRGMIRIVPRAAPKPLSLPILNKGRDDGE